MVVYEVTYDEIKKRITYVGADNVNSAKTSVKAEAKRWGYKVQNLKTKLYQE